MTLGRIDPGKPFALDSLAARNLPPHFALSRGNPGAFSFAAVAAPALIAAVMSFGAIAGWASGAIARLPPSRRAITQCNRPRPSCRLRPRGPTPAVPRMRFVPKGATIEWVTTPDSRQLNGCLLDGRGRRPRKSSGRCRISAGSTLRARKSPTKGWPLSGSSRSSKG